jgi:hypothetical protein
MHYYVSRFKFIWHNQLDLLFVETLTAADISQLHLKQSIISVRDGTSGDSSNAIYKIEGTTESAIAGL